MIKKDNQTKSKADKNAMTKDKVSYSSSHLETHSTIRELTQHSAPQPRELGANRVIQPFMHSGGH